jgi:hypothetical protein
VPAELIIQQGININSAKTIDLYDAPNCLETQTL